MNFELPIDQEKENKNKAFEALFENILNKKGEDIPTIEYGLSYPKEEFLKFLVENKNVLLHGSSTRDMETLEPRQANDTAKVSGNKNAVYGVIDPVLPIFYAIQDREKLQGNIESGTEDNPETGRQEYKFRIPKIAKENQPWTKGIIYILDRNNFVPEKDNKGESSGEWTSDKPIRPLAK